jgi:hypothetical protein
MQIMISEVEISCLCDNKFEIRHFDNPDVGCLQMQILVSVRSEQITNSKSDILTILILDVSKCKFLFP